MISHYTTPRTSCPFQNLSHFLRIPPLRGRRFLLIFFSVLFLFSNPLSLFARETIVWLPYPDDGIVLGQGFDLLTNKKTPGVCVDFIPVEDPGLETSYHLSTLNSFSDVLSSMNISASGALDMSTVLKASAKLGFAKRIRTTRTNAKYLFSANIQRGVLYTSPTLSSKLGARHPTANRELTNQIAAITLRNELPNSELDLATLCGHGFVSAIVTGIQLNAAIDTSAADAKSASTFSGSLDLDVLGGLISAKGSVTGESSEVKSLNKLTFDSFIMGGEKYILPQNIPELNDFIRKLPKLADKHPRAIEIAVTPYSTLLTTDDNGEGQVFQNASTLRPLVYAFFAVREARQRVSDVLNGLGTLKGQNLFVIPGKVELFERTHQMTQLMHRIQENLRFCQKRILKSNVDAAKAVSGEIQQSHISDNNSVQEFTIQKIFQKLRRNVRVQREQMTDIELSPCLVNEQFEDLRARATKHYFFSLVSMPIDVSTIDDALETTSDFEKKVSLLTKSSDDVEHRRNHLSEEVRRKRASCMDRHAGAIDNWRRRHDMLPREQTDDLKPDMGHRSRANVRATIDRLIWERDRECDGQVKQEEDELARLEEQLDQLRVDDAVPSSRATVTNVLARKIYEDRFFPLLRSTCEIDSRYEICLYPYEEVMEKIRRHIHLGKTELSELARILDTDR